MTDLHKAIRLIYNNAITINGNTKDDTVVVDDNGNNLTIDWAQVESQLSILQSEEQQAIIDAKNKKASAKSKLEALGLTTEEIKEAFGI
jgi:5-methylcytosine-specific restriction endonuclease McrBC regulatory subunit McrC